MIALRAIRGALGGERHCASKVDREAGRPGREAGHVQTAGSHGFDLGSVGLHRIIDAALAGALRKVVCEWFEPVLVDGGILDRRIGEHQRAGVLPLARIGWRIGHEIVVLVTVERVELAAAAAVLGGGAAARQRRHGECEDGCGYEPSDSGRHPGSPFTRQWARYLTLETIRGEAGLSNHSWWRAS